MSRQSKNELHQKFLTEFAIMKVDRIPHLSFPAKDVVSYRGDGDLPTTIKSTELDSLVDKIANKEDLDNPDSHVQEADTGDHMLNDILQESDDYEDEELLENYVSSLMEKAAENEEEDLDDEDDKKDDKKDDDKDDEDDDDDDEDEDDDDDEADVNKVIDEYDEKDKDKEDYFSESALYEDMQDYELSDKPIMKDKKNWDAPRKKKYNMPITESYNRTSKAPISYLEENDANINKLLSELDQLDEGLDTIDSANSNFTSRLVFEEADPDFDIIDDGTEDEDIVSDTTDLDEDDDDLELDIEEELIDADTEMDEEDLDDEDDDDASVDIDIDLDEDDEDDDIYSDDEF